MTQSVFSYEKVHDAIIETYEDESFWQILVNESKAESGPFDGGCLICANALQMAIPNAQIARIVSGTKGDRTQHFGIFVDNHFFDFDGSALTAKEWIDRFSSNEGINDDSLFVLIGEDPNSSAPVDLGASKEISRIIQRYLS